MNKMVITTLRIRCHFHFTPYLLQYWASRRQLGVEQKVCRQAVLYGVLKWGTTKTGRTMAAFSAGVHFRREG